MFGRKLCLGLSSGFGTSPEELIGVIHRAGFEELFIDDSGRKADVPALIKLAKEEGIGVQSLHAPFNRSDDMWDTETELGEIARRELIAYAEKCADNEIPIMVTHAFIGFDSELVPNQAGIERYGAVAERCRELGVVLALENTEGLEFLDTLMKALKGNPNVGFCWDSGHELCYNYGKDLLAEYGGRLVCTHLNDNLGISRADGKIFWTDDLHLLPFDGIRDWKTAADKLESCGFKGTLTFELSKSSKPGRHDNDIYSAMPTEVYIAQAYQRACRVAACFDQQYH